MMQRERESCEIKSDLERERPAGPMMQGPQVSGRRLIHERIRGGEDRIRTV